MASTALASKKVHRMHLLSVVRFWYTQEYKMNKKLLSNTFSSIQYLRIAYIKIGLKLVNMTLPYKFWKVKYVAGQPALSSPRRKGYTLERLGNKSWNSWKTSSKSVCTVLSLLKERKFWCVCICFLSFDNEADCPERAHTTYDSFPRILYHPQVC